MRIYGNPPLSPHEQEILRMSRLYDSPEAKQKRLRRSLSQRQARVRQLKEIVADHRLEAHPEHYRPYEIDPKTREERIAHAKWKSFEHRADAISNAEPGWRVNKARLMKASVEWRERLERLVRTRNPFHGS